MRIVCVGRDKFTFGIVSIRRYLKIARERLAIIWNNYANNERLLIIKHGTNLYCSAEMITTSKLTAPKNKMAPVTCVVGSVSGLAKKVAGHQGLQLQKVVGPDEKL